MSMKHGGQSRQARQWCLERWTGICPRCGRTLTKDMPWHAGHIIDDALGGEHHPGNYAAEHAHCSTSAGGRLGQAMKARTRQTQARTRPGFWTSKRRVA